MNRPSKHAIPHYFPYGTGATAPTFFSGTLDFLLSKNRDQLSEWEGTFLMERILSLLCELALDFWQRSLELSHGSVRGPQCICHLIGDVTTLNLLFPS